MHSREGERESEMRFPVLYLIVICLSLTVKVIAKQSVVDKVADYHRISIFLYSIDDI